jgi:hypothetical protein
MTFSPAVAQALGTTLRTQIHAGTGTDVTLEIYTASWGTLLATFELGTAPMNTATTPSPGEPSIVALTGTPYNATAAATNTAAAYRLKDRDGTVVDSGTGATAVGTVAGESFAVLTSTSFTSGQTIQLLSMSYEIPTVVTPLVV